MPQGAKVILFFIRRCAALCVGLIAFGSGPVRAVEPVAPRIGVDVSAVETQRLRIDLANAEARIESLAMENRRLNKEVKTSTLVLGGLQHELMVAREKLAAAASGQTEEVDRKRIAQAEAALAQARASADRAEGLARSQVTELQRTSEALKKRLDEISTETVRLRTQLAVTEQTLAEARTKNAADKKRAEGR